MNITSEELFSYSAVLSIDDLRATIFKESMKAVGAQSIPVVFSGFTNKDLTGIYKCSLGHCSIIRMAKALRWPFVFILEDDAYPSDDIVGYVSENLKNIPDDTSMLKLGWSDRYGYESLDDSFDVVTDWTWGTQAYIVFESAYDFWLKGYADIPERPSDHYFKYFIDHGKRVLTTKKNLFIQFCSKSSMNGYSGYIYDGKSNSRPPEGFSSLVKRLSVLKSDNYDVKREISKLGRFIYRINGGNLGDMLIASSEFQLFDSCGFNYDVISRKNKNELTSSKFNLVYGGGGGFVSYYDFSDPVKTLLKSENLEKCVIMPSSFYGCDNLVKNIFDERFVVYCRDIESYLYCKSLNDRTEFRLHDDIAFSCDVNKLLERKCDGSFCDIIDKVNKWRDGKTDGISASMIRTDREKTIEIPDGNLDISSLVSFFGEELTRKTVDDLSSLLLCTINGFERITTNRLHVSIASFLLNKTIDMYDNSYGKLKNVYDLSMNDVENIQTHFNS